MAQSVDGTEGAEETADQSDKQQDTDARRGTHDHGHTDDNHTDSLVTRASNIR